MSGPLPPPSSCPIGWQPQALAPVFYGTRDVTPADGAPVALRVFFPSLDGAVTSAPILAGCGRYPLVLLCHGHCSGDAEHYKRWFRLPAQLARSGYVVAVPHLSGVASGTHPSGDDAGVETLGAVAEWARTAWEHASVLMPAPATAVVGHSFGALLGARFASLGDVSAFAGLSGVWQDWPSGPLPIEGVDAPILVTWGGQFDFFTELPEPVWQRLTKPRHRVVFADGEHWDYLPNADLPCRSSSGPCRWVGPATDDLVAMFLSRYVPPELATNLPDAVPRNLVPVPELVLTPEQEFFAGAHLNGWVGLESDGACSVELLAETPPLVANRRTRETHSVDRPCPWVQYISVANRVLVADKPAGYHWCDFCFPARADG